MERSKEYFLNPGELIFSKKQVIVKSVLGSCVAVTIYDRVKRYGGMCHYLLPLSPSNEHNSTKFGNIAIYTLLKKFIKDNGSKKEDLVATIIGGAFIIFDEKEIFFIGDKNVDIATEILKKEKIYIKQMHTGGEHGRRVIFNTETNQLIVEMLDHITIDDLYRGEKNGKKD